MHDHGRRQRQSEIRRRAKKKRKLFSESSSPLNGKISKFRVALEILKSKNTMKDKLKSRKLWITVAGTALVTLLTQIDLPEIAKLITGIVASYNVGQGIADTKKG